MSHSFEGLFCPFRFTKSAVTGLVASVADMGLLVFLVECFHISPPLANLPSLLLGSLIQFFGNRHVVFNVERKGVLSHQMTLFAITEAISFGLNAVGFYLLIHWTSLHYAIARPIASFLVFAGFSYPVWSIIFRGARESQ